MFAVNIQQGPVHDCAWAALAGGRLVLAAACADGAVRCWAIDLTTCDPARGEAGKSSSSQPQPLASMRGHTGRVLSVAWHRSQLNLGQSSSSSSPSPLSSTPLLTSGGEDQTVRAWDPFDSVDELLSEPAPTDGSLNKPAETTNEVGIHK
eukprot:scaffold208951_cov37-Prasinocladus_malaysianus.AAC.2